MESQNNPETTPQSPNLGVKKPKRHVFSSELASKAGKIGGKAKNPNKGFGTTRRKPTND